MQNTAKNVKHIKSTTRHPLIAPLNQLLAEALATYTHSKQAHWNVRGPQFIALHQLFDEVATNVLPMVDALAERAVQLRGDASGTLKTAAAISKLSAYPSGKRLSAEAHLQAVADALAFLAEGMRHGIALADDANDPVTVDMLTEMTATLDKYLWFVESHLQ